MCVCVCVCMCARASDGETRVRLRSDVSRPARRPSDQPQPRKLLGPGSSHVASWKRLVDRVRGLLCGRTWDFATPPATSFAQEIMRRSNSSVLTQQVTQTPSTPWSSCRSLWSSFSAFSSPCWSSSKRKGLSRANELYWWRRRISRLSWDRSPRLVYRKKRNRALHHNGCNKISQLLVAYIGNKYCPVVWITPMRIFIYF